MAVLGRKPTQQFEKLREAAQKARAPYDKDMLLNLAFFLDHQYTEWVADGSFVRTIPRAKGAENTPRPVANKIMHFVVQQHAYALANKPNPDVLPATDDPQDLSLTAPALAYLRWLADPQVGDYDAELADATWWALITGEGYLKWFYNDKEKRPDFMSVSPLDVFVDPYATRFGNVRYVIHSRFMETEQVNHLFGKQLKPQAVSRQDQTKAALMREMGQAPILNGVIVNEIWVEPKVIKGYDDGLMCTWAGDEILQDPTNFPYEHKQLPFSQLGCIPRPGSAHFTSPVKYLRSPQMELNKYHSQRIQVRQNFANPKWWLANELELEQDPDDSPNQILRGNSAGGTLRPEIIQPDTFPEGSDGNWIVSEMQDVVGLHEVSSAQVPGRVESARAIESLKESDVSRLNQLEQTIKKATSEGFWQCLMLAKQYTPEEQIVQTYSREGLPEVRKFKAEKLTPGMRIQVTMGTGLSRSRAQRQEQALMMWREGIVIDPEIMAELLDVPVGTIAPQQAYDIRLARNENLLMASGEQGVAVTPNSWDAHAIHLREHNNFRKTSEFDALSEETKKKFEYHCQQHDVLEMTQIEKQAQKQAAAQMVMPEDAPPGEGGETPPAAEPPKTEADNDREPIE